MGWAYDLGDRGGEHAGRVDRGYDWLEPDRLMGKAPKGNANVVTENSRVAML